jgi:hypothetical protein
MMRFHVCIIFSLYVRSGMSMTYITTFIQCMFFVLSVCRPLILCILQCRHFSCVLFRLNSRRSTWHRIPTRAPWSTFRCREAAPRLLGTYSCNCFAASGWRANDAYRVYHLARVSLLTADFNMDGSRRPVSFICMHNPSHQTSAPSACRPTECNSIRQTPTAMFIRIRWWLQ